MKRFFLAVALAAALPCLGQDYPNRPIRLITPAAQGGTTDILARIFGILGDAYRDDRQIFLMGNGGSAALASHFAVDMGKGTSHEGRPRFRVISLVDNTPVMTALANDFSYADVFSEQIRSLVQAGDVVFGISGSGNSPNVLKGLAEAKEAMLTTSAARAPSRLVVVVFMMIPLMSDDE